MEPKRKRGLGAFMLQVSGIAIAGALLEELDLEGMRRLLPTYLRPGEDPLPYLRLFDAAEALRDSRRTFRAALVEWAERTRVRGPEDRAPASPAG